MRELSRERSKEMSCGSHEEIIQALNKSQQMQVLRGIEIAIEEGIKEVVVDKYRYQGGIEEQSIKCKNRSSIYPLAVKKLLRLRCEKSLRSSIDSQLLRRCRANFSKQFSRSEKHRHECNPTCNLTNDPINILSSQRNLLTIIFKHLDLKNTHIHTKQV